MEVLVRVAGGVALLLWGLHMTRTGLLRGFGHRLRQLVQRSGDRPFVSFFAGATLATVLQSSMAVITIAASLSGKKLLLPTTVVLIALGADLGSAIAAQIAGYAVGWLSPVLIAFGVIAFETGSGDAQRNLGRAAIGAGLILLSLELLKAAFAPLGASPVLFEVIGVLAAQPMLLVLLASILAVATHSGLAIVVIVAALATGGIVDPTSSLYLVLGANLGSGLAVLAATRSMPIPMRVAPVANVVARSAGVGVGFFFLLFTAPRLTGLPPHSLVLTSHLVFNGVLALLAMPFAGALVGIAQRLLPSETVVRSTTSPLHLDMGQLADDDLAIGNARREVVRIADAVQSMLADIAAVLQGPNSQLEPSLVTAENQVDEIYKSVKSYAADFARLHGRTPATDEMMTSLAFATELEHIGDIITHNLGRAAARKNKNKRYFSEAGMQEILALHELVLRNMKLATNAFVTGDTRLAQVVIDAGAQVQGAAQKSVDAHFARVVERAPESVETGALHIDVLRDLERINSHLERLGQLAAIPRKA